MKEDHEQKLRHDFPKLFVELGFGFECGDGWFEIIYSLSTHIQKIIDEKQLDMWATQVKEKYGGLRFYMSSATDEIFDLIEKAESLSCHTCEICGQTGTFRCNTGWYQTLCDKCV